MSVRLTLLALSTLGLSACDSSALLTPARQAACCCDHCPTTAAPAATPTRTVRAEASRDRPSTGARTYRVRTEPVVVRETRIYGQDAYDEGLSGGYGGRYGARGGASAGASVSVQESEFSSSRYSYSESSGGYAYGGAATAGGPQPQQPYVRYKSASTTPGGWLEWPGKVQD